MENNTNVVPFGKYKGQPIEVLQQDSQYLTWLMQQDWFKGRYPSLVQIVVNNFKEPDESPEHNALQIKFMSDDFCEKVMICAGNIKREYFKPLNIKTFSGYGLLSRKGQGIEMHQDEYEVKFLAWGRKREVSKSFEVGGIDVICSIAYSYTHFHWTENGEIVGESEKPPETNCKYRYKQLYEDVCFEYQSFEIELKPSVGGDFPAIMRQIKANRRGGRRVLLAERFACENVSLEDVKKFFANEGIIFLLVSDVEEYWLKSEDALLAISDMILHHEQESYYGQDEPMTFDAIVTAYKASHE